MICWTRYQFLSCACVALLLFSPIFAGSRVNSGGQGPEEDPPEIVIGERLFLETRFAQFFAKNATDPNQELPQGDPVMDVTRTPREDLSGPFKGKSMNCRACHLVDEHASTPGAGMRTYADFARRSPIPFREDAKTVTLRNSPAQVNASLQREFMFFHFDGQFVTMEDLVKATLTGRNFGWMSHEEKQAYEHIAYIIRTDDGTYPLSAESGGRYARIFQGTDSDIPPKFQLPPEYRIDVKTATDVEIVEAVSKLIAVYVTDLKFHQDNIGYDTSPYDVFLRRNNLPVVPENGESPLEYSRRLLKKLEESSDFKFVTAQEHSFKHHNQPFVFGTSELEGLKIFLREPPARMRSDELASQGKVGNCSACHQAPHFTDFLFHNTSVAQEEYDSIHGSGAFLTIPIPGAGPQQDTLKGFAERQRNPRAYLPTQPQHPPIASGQFADIPSKDKPGHTDLGLWNVFLNPNFPKPQESLIRMLRKQYPTTSELAELLQKTVATFKTPGLRDLGHSAPYFHTGRFDALETVIRFYIDHSKMARIGHVRSADRELGRIYLVDDDIPKLAAFLYSLNEDYE